MMPLSLILRFFFFFFLHALNLYIVFARSLYIFNLFHLIVTKDEHLEFRDLPPICYDSLVEMNTL